jgi:predicted hotdog family 3-hydroxylacyl-ACP dehydratase
MRFPLFDGRVRLPEGHPMSEGGVFPALALVELAAQAAGHAVAEALAAAADGTEVAAHGGMLVEIESATILRAAVPVGEVLTVDVRLDRVMGALRRYRVRIDGVLEVGLTLRIGAAA